MSYPTLQTPQRELPGAFLQTPAGARYASQPPIRQPVFQRESFPGLQGGAQAQGQAQRQQAAQAPEAPHVRPLQPIQRAARTINETLQKESSFPDLDSYVKQGISSDYEVPSPITEPAWAPFQKTKMYNIPDTIFEQYNRAQVQTMMGLFAELNHAWVTIDNALYLWDYTHPNPELVGFEEQANSITAVKLVKPRPGVFVQTLTHILVVATTADIFLLGVAASSDVNGIKTVELYQTRMSLSIRGIDVRVIEGSNATGRIFFAGHGDNEVYELSYQQEEKWFASRCAKICHTSPGYTSLMPRVFSQRSQEFVRDIVIDDSRRLLYTLSSESSIRTFHMDSATTLHMVIEKRQQECLRDISHMTSASPLLTGKMSIVSVNPISAREASKLHLMATTSTGCRLFLSATRGYGYLNNQGAPQSMQVQHIKFPPRAPSQQPGQAIYNGGETATETGSDALSHTRLSLRYPPGFFLCFVTKESNVNHDALFVSAPDTGRISAQARDLSAQASKYYEQAVWLELGSRAEAIGLVTKPFAAAPQPFGFGNELAVQYDEPATEIAILTNTGVHTIRRRRLVDVFAAALRQNGGDEGLENEIKKFIRQYGRGETTATALAVACGQGSDVAPGDTRMARVSDPETLELARKAFVEYGGRPSMNENTVAEGSMLAVDTVTPSSRHAGLALYMSRLVRSVWKASVITQGTTLTGEISITSTINPAKLLSVQENLTRLASFLEKNKTFIEGLTGPEGLQRATSKQEEVALQGEHQALHSLQMLNSSIIEGISFVLMLFDERVDEIWVALDDTTRQRLRELTYELLFATETGKDLAKVLVKAIVNRNIAKDSNVTQVAEALRRRCGSFCSADDVVIFKSQELLKQAAEAGGVSDQARKILNESLRLFQSVAGSLSFENLQNAVGKFTEMQFYAGAITLALDVAAQSDRGNKALYWINDGRPENDDRKDIYAKRKQCYDLIHQILQMVDEATAREPEIVDGRFTLAATKRNEAHIVVNKSEDEIFQFDLYDWYLNQGWTDRLLGVDSRFVEIYLERKAVDELDKADLLWRFYANQEDYYKAADVQHNLAKSQFAIPLAKRITYLSHAKTHASTQSAGIGRQARQILLHEVSELLEIANIQDELLHKLRSEDRLTAERKAEIVAHLDGEILALTDLYNRYADPASYFDICLIICQAANHRTDADIMSTWQNLLDVVHTKIVEDPNATVQPYEAIINIVCDMASRLNFSESTFSPAILIPMIERYAFEQQRDVGPRTWVVDLFLRVHFPHEIILSTLTSMFYNDEAPFSGRNRRVIAEHILYILEQWYQECASNNMRLFGGEQNAVEIDQLLIELIDTGGFQPAELQGAQQMRARIARDFR
ncbi:non-repetitive/WGA-negative nucleoporin [Phlyctema vagabunda]|uniref:Non-repetitive/WGA-negative nucleoporin n=1 Tax=Phlyctema vagabunda TaxID=108571 RepID=A0ABR4PYP1_9HELO